jgi:hypothetical protein
MTTDIHFHVIEGPNLRVPVITDRETIEYTCDGKEGTLCFDGYYYVEDHAPPYPEDEALIEWKRPHRNPRFLPDQLYLFVKHRESEPYKTEWEEGCRQDFFHTIEEHAYKVEIYKRVIHYSTDRLSNIEDSDGEEMTVCFFPTNKQTIYFRILEDVTQTFGKED